MARRFKTNSAFGAALAAMIWWSLALFRPHAFISGHFGTNLAWWATMFYAVSIALRLARFDSEIRDPAEESKDYFTGVPAPAAAFLVLVPIAVDLEFGIAWAREAAYVCGWLVAMGALAVSAVPTFAGKGVKLPVGAVLPVMAAGSILIAGVFMQPWITYMVLALAYVSTIPLSVMRFYRRQSQG